MFPWKSAHGSYALVTTLFEVSNNAYLREEELWETQLLNCLMEIKADSPDHGVCGRNTTVHSKYRAHSLTLYQLRSWTKLGPQKPAVFNSEPPRVAFSLSSHFLSERPNLPMLRPPVLPFKAPGPTCDCDFLTVHPSCKMQENRASAVAPSCSTRAGWYPHTALSTHCC